MVTSLNNKEPKKIYFSANVSTFHIAYLVLGNIFVLDISINLERYGLIKYPTWISFTVTGIRVSFRTFLCIIFNILSISTCFGKNFCTNLLLLIRPCNSGGSWKYDLLGLWNISDITPFLYGKFSSKSMLMSNASVVSW